MPRTKLRALAFLAIPILLCLHCEAQAGIAGDWQGTLAGDEVQLRLVFHIVERGDGLEATIDSLDQGAIGVQTISVMFDEGTLTIATGRIGSEYEGLLSADGQTIRGSWKQRGASVPLVLTRRAASPARKQLAEKH